MCASYQHMINIVSSINSNIWKPTVSTYITCEFCCFIATDCWLYGVYTGYCCPNDQAYNFNWKILSVVIVTQLCCLYNGSMVLPPSPPDKCTSIGHQLQVRTARFPVFCSKLNWSANLIFTNWNYDIHLKLLFCPPPSLWVMMVNSC